MKLLYCSSCSDVFKLKKELQTCACGRAQGRMFNPFHIEATYQTVIIDLEYMVARKNPTRDAYTMSSIHTGPGVTRRTFEEEIV